MRKPDTIREGMTCTSAVARAFGVAIATLNQRLGSSDRLDGCTAPQALTPDEAAILQVSAQSRIKLFPWTEENEREIRHALASRSPTRAPALSRRSPSIFSATYIPGRFRQ